MILYCLYVVLLIRMCVCVIDSHLVRLSRFLLNVERTVSAPFCILLPSLPLSDALVVSSPPVRTAVLITDAAGFECPWHIPVAMSRNIQG